jgi:hypothetical protein
MPETAFIITIDTEGDNLWAAPREITTRNAHYLPRFQALCERYRFAPVYLVNYEMAQSDAFVEFGRDVLARGAGEIGMHLHAWNSPPLDALTDDDFRHQPYLTEYSDALLRAKVDYMTDLLEDRFAVKMTSHRAGRWKLDSRYVSALLARGYRADCSVTPGIDWSRNRGDPEGDGGANYTSFPEHAYFMRPEDISRPAEDGLLEVPATIRPSLLYRLAPWAYRIPVVRSVAYRLSPPHAWVGPGESPLRGMLRAANGARADGADHIEFALHSSELMPGGSPTFRTAADIEALYRDLEVLFAHLAPWCRGLTLQQFHARFAQDTSRAPTAGDPFHARFAEEVSS